MTPETYTGQPCNVCGGKMRYRSNRHCVACAQKHIRTSYSPINWAVQRNTILALYYPQQFDLEGWAVKEARR